MEVQYHAPNGDRIWVIDTAGAGRHLGTMLQKFRAGEEEPLFFADEPADDTAEVRPEGVVISFKQWAEYEAMREEVEAEQRRIELARHRIATARPEDWVSFEDAAREDGWDLSVLDDDEGGRPDNR